MAKKKSADELAQMVQRRKDIQAAIHEAYRPVPDYERIEELSQEMHKIDTFLYDLEVKRRK